MISISRLRRTIALSMLLFYVSGTTGYPSGIEIVNASFCGECLSFDLFLILFKRYSALKSCSGILEIEWEVKNENSSKEKKEMLICFLTATWKDLYILLN